MSRFYHYACSHSITKILKGGGTLIPNRGTGFQPKVAARFRELFPGRPDTDMQAFVWPVIWVTDVDVRTEADARLIGLGQLEGNLTDCYRVEYRFLVPNVGIAPWRQWADEHIVEPDECEARGLLETAYGCDPERWWVADKPITGCRLDQHYHAVREEA